MNHASDYRACADTERREAEASRLPRVRELHLAAAERWDALAREAEIFEPRKAFALTLPEWMH